MALGILGRKVGMTQIFGEAGEMIPVTIIEAGPCHVLRVLTAERDGYEAVQLGFGDRPRAKANRADRGQVAKLDSKRSKRLAQSGTATPQKADCEPKRFVREFRGAPGELSVGAVVAVPAFEGVKAVDVTGISKGRGFAGVMKRHNFSGQRASHGVKKVHRHAGGTGCNTFPARTFKGKRMAGQLGAERCTMRNLRLVRVDAENNLLVVRGAVPGPNGGYVMVRPTNKIKG